MVLVLYRLTLAEMLGEVMRLICRGLEVRLLKLQAGLVQPLAAVRVALHQDIGQPLAAVIVTLHQDFAQPLVAVVVIPHQ
jgi:hypothetical protein